MKKLKNIHLFILLFFLFSCNDEGLFDEESILSSFDKPFPKKPKDLSLILEGNLLLSSEEDTTTIKIKFNPETKENIIISQEGDTILLGTVCKYRNLYYFNEEVNDTTYHIHAFKIEKHTIRGLDTKFFQMKALDDIFEQLQEKSDSSFRKYKPLLISFDEVNQIIRLRPHKKTMRKFYELVVEEFPEMTIIKKSDTIEKQNNSANNKLENLRSEIVDKLYPNPAKRIVNIDLREKGNFQYQILDKSGIFVKKGELLSKLNQIDISNLKNGLYFLKIYNNQKKEIETKKLIIEK